MKKLLLLLSAFALFTFVGCEKDDPDPNQDPYPDKVTTPIPEVKDTIIPASYLDSTQWTNNWLVPYGDVTMGFDFSTDSYVDTDRDGYYDMNTSMFVLVGNNKVKDLGHLDYSAKFVVPSSWDGALTSLTIGNTYAIACADGYVLMHVTSFMSCCDEYEIDYTFVPTADIVIE